MDEIHLLLDTLVQWSFLTVHSASFTENFFSLVKRNVHGSTWTPRQTATSLVFNCLVPYLTNKLDSCYQRLIEKQYVDEKQDRMNEYEYSFLQIYPNIKKTFQLLKIILWIRYAGSSSSCNPNLELWALGSDIDLVYKNPDFNISSASRFSVVALALTKVFEKTLNAGTFAIQFWQYWQANGDFRKKLSLSYREDKGDIPPPIGKVFCICFFT